MRHGWWKCVRALVNCKDIDLTITYGNSGETALDLLEVSLDHTALRRALMQGEGASLGHDDDAVDGIRVEPKYHVCFPKSSEVFAEAVRISLIMRLSYCNEGIMSPWAANISSVSFQISSMDSSAAV